jgi:protein ImuA
MSAAAPSFQALRAEIARIEAGRRPPGGVLPFGLAALDRRLPAGGLALGALHEVAGGGDGASTALSPLCLRPASRRAPRDPCSGA